MPRQQRRGGPESRVRPTGGRRRHFDISEAPEPSTGGSGARSIGTGNHPHYCAIAPDGSYGVVKTEWGLHETFVATGLKTPREAIDLMFSLNQQGGGA